jgi:hypothetical protein
MVQALKALLDFRLGLTQENKMSIPNTPKHYLNIIRQAIGLTSDFPTDATDDFTVKKFLEEIRDTIAGISIPCCGLLTTTPLLANATFTSPSFDLENCSHTAVQWMGISDKGSAVNGIKIQQSWDNVNWDLERTETAMPNTARSDDGYIRARYVRFSWLNGGVNQTYLRLGYRLWSGFDHAA